MPVCINEAEALSLSFRWRFFTLPISK